MFDFNYFLIEIMYQGKASLLAKKKQQQKKNQKLKQQIQKNAQKVREIYDNFQTNMNQFAKKHKNQINSDSKFRDKFSEMCQQFDVNPMLEKHLELVGIWRFLSSASMKILDICAKHRHQNGGIMKIDDVVAYYQKKEKGDISRNDVIRAMEHTYILGNASIIDKQYVCTIPLEMNSHLSQLLAIADKFGFISALLLKQEKIGTLKSSKVGSKIQDEREFYGLTKSFLKGKDLIFTS